MKKLQKLLLLFMIISGIDSTASEKNSDSSSSYGSIQDSIFGLSPSKKSSSSTLSSKASTGSLEKSSTENDRIKAATKIQNFRRSYVSRKPKLERQDSVAHIAIDIEDEKEECREENEQEEANRLFQELIKHTTASSTDNLRQLKAIIPKTSLSPSNKDNFLSKINEELSKNRVTPGATQRAFSDEESSNSSTRENDNVAEKHDDESDEEEEEEEKVDAKELIERENTIKIEELAAKKIQALSRGHLARKHNKKHGHKTHGSSHHDHNKHTNHSSVKQKKHENNPLDKEPKHSHNKNQHDSAKHNSSNIQTDKEEIENFFNYTKEEVAAMEKQWGLRIEALKKNVNSLVAISTITMEKLKNSVDWTAVSAKTFSCYAFLQGKVTSLIKLMTESKTK